MSHCYWLWSLISLKWVLNCENKIQNWAYWDCLRDYNFSLCVTAANSSAKHELHYAFWADYFKLQYLYNIILIYIIFPCKHISFMHTGIWKYMNMTLRVIFAWKITPVTLKQFSSELYVYDVTRYEWVITATCWKFH